MGDATGIGGAVPVGTASQVPLAALSAGTTYTGNGGDRNVPGDGSLVGGLKFLGYG